MDHADQFDVLIVGAGAAGLATAIFTARRVPHLRIACLDGARKLGAKILVSGGGRCNITNVRVTPEDFWGGSRNAIRRVLNALTESQTADFFRELGVGLHEEQWGKLFPDSNSAKTVLNALLSEAARLSISILSAHRVVDVRRAENPGFEITCQRPGPRASARATSAAPADGLSLMGRTVVLATGGRSLPKTGSDGLGYDLAKCLGHSIVPTTPALAPLVLDGDFHAGLSGVSHEVEVIVRAEGEKPVRIAGPMLWTHFGASGPAIMDASRHWHRVRQEGKTPRLSLNFLLGRSFESAEQLMIDLAAAQPRANVRNALGTILPARLAETLLTRSGIGPQVVMGQLVREDRRRIVHALLDWPLPVVDSRGYNYAEATAGGVPLSEIDASTMQSRVCPGVFLVGEILDVDGRIGGFNFQWAWSSGYVAAWGIERFLLCR